MSWRTRYLEQERAWLREAHAWATHGKEEHAQRCRDNAYVYRYLAEREAEHELRLERHRLIRVARKILHKMEQNSGV